MLNRQQPFILRTRSELEKIEYLMSVNACNRYSIKISGDTGLERLLCTLSMSPDYFFYNLVSHATAYSIEAIRFLEFLKKQPYDYKSFAQINSGDYIYAPAEHSSSFTMSEAAEANYNLWPTWAIEALKYPINRSGSISVLFPRCPGAVYGVTRIAGIIDPIFRNDLVLLDPVSHRIDIIPDQLLMSTCG
jgi:hypothetical protein